MRRYLLKLLKTGLPTAAILALFGYAFAQFAGMWYVSDAGGRESPVGAVEVARSLEWRLPLTMAAWGFGLVALFEGVLSLWRAPAPAEPAHPIIDATEQLLLKLLEEADAAEEVRREATDLAQTPLPKGLPSAAEEASSPRPQGRVESRQAP